MHALSKLLLAYVGAAYGSVAGVHVHGPTSSFRDSLNRSLVFRGTNFVEKSAPYYPTITEEQVTTMLTMGFNVVRLGVMLPGLLPISEEVDASYLVAINDIVDTLWAEGIASILDLHQDVLAPRICGEGSPDWMLNVSELHSMPFPEPLTFNQSQVVKPDPTTGGWEPGFDCGAVGPLKAIGWSEFYMTDACGKAFQQVYDDKGVMAAMFRKFWATVASHFKGHPGVLAYELLNEPWVGDVVESPELLLLPKKAERETVGPFMQRMHDVVRAVDNDTMTLFAPAEINNRLMRHVGYEAGFLPGSPMAYHIYCLTGTDGPGPTTNITIELCHINDGLQASNREADIHRLQTAGFVTEFGAVSDVDTGLAEVRYVANHMDSASPPLSWAFWDRVPAALDYQMELGRAYARAVAGDVVSMAFAFEDPRATLALEFIPSSAAATELVLPAFHFPQGFDLRVDPAIEFTFAATDYGAAVTLDTSTLSPSQSVTLYADAK